MGIVNPLRHPQTLFVGFPDDDPRVARMGELVGEWRVLGAASELEELRPQDWDVLIAEGVGLGVDWPVPEHLHVLAFGCAHLGMAKRLWAGGLPASHMTASNMVERCASLTGWTRRFDA